MNANVAELVKGLQAEAQRGAAVMLERYAGLVMQAARVQLSAADAEQAANLAYDLELPPDRFDRDVAAVRQAEQLEEQIRLDDAEAARNREKCAGFKQRLEELEIERRQTLMQQDRLVGEARNRQERKTLQQRILKDHLHLFAEPGTLTDAQWKAIRQ